MGVDEVKVSSERANGKLFLKFEFIGSLKGDVALEAISRWEMMMETQMEKGEKADIVWNCERMAGYESDARKSWQNMLKESKEQIGDIWIVTSKTMFRVAAKTMALLTNYNLKAVSSESEIFKTPSLSSKI